MKLTRLELRDFRQFRGQQHLDFAGEPGKGVTLIHAENGVGKTTLLNAVLWALYAKTTPKFNQPSSLVHFGAAKKGIRNAMVRVTFEFRGENYIAQRFANEGATATNFEVSRMDKGVKHTLGAPDTFMSQVIPPTMAPYFFFDGEQAEFFASEQKFKEIGEAIRNMLGFDIAKTSIEDLDYVIKEFRRAMQSLKGAQELRDLEEELSKCSENVEYLQRNCEKLTTERAVFKAQLEEIDQTLKTYAGAKDLHTRRLELEEQLRNLEADLVRARSERVGWVASNAPALVSRRMREETLNFVDEESLKGRIPSPYNEEFVRGLLQSEMCICDRHIGHGSKEWQSVARLLHNASNAVILGRMIQARSRIRMMKERAELAARELSNIEEKEGRLKQKQQEYQQKLAELVAKIKSIPMNEIGQMENARIDLKRKIERVEQEYGAAKKSLQIAEQKAPELERKLHEAAQKNEQARKLETHAQLAAAAKHVLQAELELYEREARKTIQDRINQILAEVSRKDYSFAFGENLSIYLRFADGRVVPRSSGENQLLGLLFTAALAQFSRDRASDQTKLLIPGTVAPLVLDSPLGQLDEQYREATARFLPTMADQVVLLVSSSQGDRKVLDALEPYVGAEYVLVSHNMAPQSGKPEDIRMIAGKEYRLSLYGQPEDHTEIRRVR